MGDSECITWEARSITATGPWVGGKAPIYKNGEQPLPVFFNVVIEDSPKRPVPNHYFGGGALEVLIHRTLFRTAT